MDEWMDTGGIEDMSWGGEERIYGVLNASYFKASNSAAYSTHLFRMLGAFTVDLS